MEVSAYDDVDMEGELDVLDGGGMTLVSAGGLETLGRAAPGWASAIAPCRRRRSSAASLGSVGWSLGAASTSPAIFGAFCHAVLPCAYSSSNPARPSRPISNASALLALLYPTPPFPNPRPPHVVLPSFRPYCPLPIARSAFLPSIPLSIIAIPTLLVSDIPCDALSPQFLPSLPAIQCVPSLHAMRSLPSDPLSLASPAAPSPFSILHFSLQGAAGSKPD
ncbi:hypothetical protein DFH09DRAFT_1472366 [Mycena vulgaris]|nr:hypothetical protein DFH09DRAFT_1472366 [Mycena vulgaris]